MSIVREMNLESLILLVQERQSYKHNGYSNRNIRVQFLNLHSSFRSSRINHLIV
jgi:hypothetical protein